MRYKRFLQLKDEVEAVLTARTLGVDLEPGSLWYDFHHAVKVRQRKPSRGPLDSSYISSWLLILQWIGNFERIADFGCGEGLFAQLAVERGKKYVLGVDFSPVALSLARKRNPAHSSCFLLSDLYNPKVYKTMSYDVAVLLETLEHLKRDLFVLQQIPAGKHVLLSVPNLHIRGHCRCFQTLDEAEARYSPLLELRDSAPVQVSKSMTLWLLNGVRK